MRSVTVVLLAAISLVFCGCFQDDPARPEVPRPSSKLSLSRVQHTPASQANAPNPALNKPFGAVTEYCFSIPESLNERDLDLPTIFAPGNAPRIASETGRENGYLPTRAGAGSRATRARLLEARQENPGISLNASFRSLFADVFSRREGDFSPEAFASLSAEEEILNPFTDAKKQIEAEKAQAAAAEGAAQPVKQNPASSASSSEEKESASAPLQRNALNAGKGGISKRDANYIFLGDFDGSGTLRPVFAQREGEAKFAFEDASRTFVVLSNSSAIENQRSAAIEDLDGDGNMDLLLTSRASLFGAVLLGDGQGSFRVSDSFLTGYEPTVAVPGPMREGGREILTVNIRSGSTVAFRPQGHYLRYSQGDLRFIPDYVARLANLETGLDYLLAGQIGNAPNIYDWPGNTQLSELYGALPSEPSIAVGSEAAGESGIGSLQVYQVGSFASVVLTNSQGQTFNVANLRVTPQVFLLFGDIEGRGTLDVGIAILLAVNQ